MIPRVGGVLLSPGGHHGNRGTVYLEAVALTTIALPNAGTQPPLPIAIRVPTRMPTADSFVGMPFMRPTLRMHCPSTLQRHTITEDRQRKVRAVREGSQLLSAFSPAQLAITCASVPVYVSWVWGWDASSFVHVASCPDTHVQVCTGICCPHEPADMLPSPSRYIPVAPSETACP